MIRRRVFLGAAFLALFALGWWVGRGAARGELYANLDLFVEVLQKVEQNYVEPVEPSKLVDGAIRGMLLDLDPYSQYLEPKSLELLRSATEGSFGGIGIVVSVRDGYPTVISPVEGTPAWEAGLQSGDVIVRIDGRPTEDLTVEETAHRLRGDPGTQVKLGVRREGDPEEHDFTLTRRVIQTKSVPYAFVTAGGVGYLRLADFSERSGAEVRDAVRRLRTEGAHSLVLDLRSNPGGLLKQAVDVVEQFVPKGDVVVSTRGRARGQNHRYLAADDHPELRWPMAVMVDGGSASASEIVAGALQDLDRALVVGRTTYGKGSVQTLYPLEGGEAAVKLTTAHYITPSGRSIHRADRDSAFLAAHGVTPDEEAAEPAAGARAVFHTASGRTVYGGGGITPDLAVPIDSLPPVVRSLELKGTPFRFATLFANTHPGLEHASPLPQGAWSAFLGFVARDSAAVPRDSLEAERTPLERALRRELARRLSGDAGAMRVALETDPVFAAARRALARARRPADVFADVAPERTGSR